MKTTEIKKLAKAGEVAELRVRLKEIEAIVTRSDKPEQRLRNEAVIILGVLDN